MQILTGIVIAEILRGNDRDKRLSCPKLSLFFSHNGRNYSSFPQIKKSTTIKIQAINSQKRMTNSSNS